MSPLNSGNNELLSREEAALLIAERDELRRKVQELRDISFEAHRQAATWAKATGELSRLLGKKALEDAGFEMPDFEYIAQILNPKS